MADSQACFRLSSPAGDGVTVVVTPAAKAVVLRPRTRPPATARALIRLTKLRLSILSSLVLGPALVNGSVGSVARDVVLACGGRLVRRREVALDLAQRLVGGLRVCGS